MLNPLRGVYLFGILTIASITHHNRCTATPTPSESTTSPLLPRGASGSTPRLAFGTTTLNTSQLPLILALSDTESRTSDTHSIDTIRNKLALCTYAVDGQQLTALDAVFASNAVADYGGGIGLLNGLDEIKSGLSRGGMSQTLLGNVFVEVLGERDAWSVAYWRSVRWGGDASGDVVTGFGMYQDSWFRTNPGDQGWRIIRRNLVDQAPSVTNSSTSMA